MAKLYWADAPDAMAWDGPYESVEECRRAAWEDHAGESNGEIWVAPIDAENDDDDRFWEAFASLLLCEAEHAEETLMEDGWLDPEDTWLPTVPNDRDGIIANALRQVLGPRPAWRCVDTSRAERVDLG